MKMIPSSSSYLFFVIFDIFFKCGSLDSYEKKGGYISKTNHTFFRPITNGRKDWEKVYLEKFQGWVGCGGNKKLGGFWLINRSSLKEMLKVQRMDC